MTTSSLLNPAYKDWLESVVNPFETLALLEKSEVSDVDLSDISEALEEYVRLFKAEIASPAEILTLSRAYPNEEKYSLAVIDKELDQKEPVVIGGPASVEVVDREGHIITLAAMKRAFERFMANFRTRNAMVLHSDVQVGWALPAYISKTGKIYKSGVTGDHLFFITELRDDTKIAKKVLEQISTGKMKSYSIAGSATSVEPSTKDGAVVMQVNDMELAEVTICEQGVNQRAKFELMKSATDRPTSSCVDGSCLTKSQEHAHSNTELFVNANGIIDTVGSFTNWVQKEELMEPNKNSTDALYAYLHKEAVTDPEDFPALQKPSRVPHGSGGSAAALNRQRVAASKGKKPPQRWRGPPRGYERRPPPGEQNGKEVLEMQKSHLEGCLCEECKQRTGDTNGDDTPRLATDTQGRPTLGHAGHGNAVAILVSRMQRKASDRADRIKEGYPFHPEDRPRTRTESDPVHQSHAAAKKQGHTRTIRRDVARLQGVLGNPSSALTEEEVEEARHEATGTQVLEPRTNATVRMMRNISRRGEARQASATRPPKIENMQKAVYEYIHKSNMEKGVLGAVGKVVGGAAKGAAKVTGALTGGVIGGAEALFSKPKELDSLGRETGRRVGQSRFGRLAGFGETASESRVGQASRPTPQTPQMNMEKQEPEWTTPQTETPLHKFLDHNSKNERRS